MKETYWNDDGGNPIRSVSGGAKRMWIQKHREEIIDFVELRGRKAALKAFGLKEFTLDTLLASTKEPWKGNFTKADRALARVEITDQGLADLRRELRELREAFALFQENVSTQLTEKFFKPLLARAIQPGPGLEAKPTPDPLLIGDLGKGKPFNIVSEASKVITQYKKDGRPTK